MAIIDKLPPVNPQPCNDAISRQAVFKIQAKYAEYIGATKFWQMSDDIKALPPVTPQPKIGHWIKTSSGFKCSKCLIVHSHTSLFCQSCGAKMIEPQESEG